MTARAAPAPSHPLSIAIRPATTRMRSTIRSDTRSPRSGRLGRPSTDAPRPVRPAPDAAGDGLSIRTTIRFPFPRLPAHCLERMLSRRTVRPIAPCAGFEVGRGPGEASTSERVGVGFDRSLASSCDSFRPCAKPVAGSLLPDEPHPHILIKRPSPRFPSRAAMWRTSNCRLHLHRSSVQHRCLADSVQERPQGFDVAVVDGGSPGSRKDTSLERRHPVLRHRRRGSMATACVAAADLRQGSRRRPGSVHADRANFTGEALTDPRVRPVSRRGERPSRSPRQDREGEAAISPDRRRRPVCLAQSPPHRNRQHARGPAEIALPDFRRRRHHAHSGHGMGRGPGRVRSS